MFHIMYISLIIKPPPSFFFTTHSKKKKMEVDLKTRMMWTQQKLNLTKVPYIYSDW